MSIFELFKKKTDYITEETSKVKSRKQLNVTVSPRTFERIRHLSAELSVPRYIIAEHLVDVGYFYVTRILDNPQRRALLRKHLIDQHLLNTISSDPEEVLRSGEGHYKSELIELSIKLLRAANEFRKAIAYTQKTGDAKPLNAAERNFNYAGLVLADWFSKNPLDEIEENE